jgi:hypothetical protein
VNTRIDVAPVLDPSRSGHNSRRRGKLDHDPDVELDHDPDVEKDGIVAARIAAHPVATRAQPVCGRHRRRLLPRGFASLPRGCILSNRGTADAPSDGLSSKLCAARRARRAQGWTIEAVFHFPPKLSIPGSGSAAVVTARVRLDKGRKMTVLILRSINRTKGGCMRLSLAMLSAAALAAGLSAPAPAADGDWGRVSKALGKSGTVLPGGIYRVVLPRSDLKATLDGVALKPTFALGGWVAFEKVGQDAMIMGDLVLTQSEVNPVMSKLFAGGIEITALHNHLLRNRPFTMYLHVFGEGDPVKLATALHNALAASRTPLSAAASGSSQSPPAPTLDIAAIGHILGAKGKNAGGVYQFSFPRAEPIREGGMVVPPAMGVANAINFEPTGDGKAAITGDFVLTGHEVNPVAKALRAHGIEVTAVHNHMLGEEPRLFFLHFWAHDDAKKLAEGLKAALANVNVKRG